MEAARRVLDQRNEVHRLRAGIDHRRAGDAGAGDEVPAVVEVGARQGRADVRVPEHGPGRVGVERIDAVVLGHDEHDVVHLATDLQPRDEERLRVDVAVDRLRELLAEVDAAHVGGSERRLLRVVPRPAVVVVVGEDARGRRTATGAGAAVASAAPAPTSAAAPAAAPAPAAAAARPPAAPAAAPGVGGHGRVPGVARRRMAARRAAARHTPDGDRRGGLQSTPTSHLESSDRRVSAFSHATPWQQTLVATRAAGPSTRRRACAASRRAVSPSRWRARPGEPRVHPVRVRERGRRPATDDRRRLVDQRFVLERRHHE